MKYLITDDKRIVVYNVIFLLSCLVYAIIEIFILSKIKIVNETWQTIWVIFQCGLGLSPALLYVLTKRVGNKLLMKLCGIKDLTGTYKGKITSNQNNKITDIDATIVIKHDIDNMIINFSTDSSKSKAKNITLSIEKETVILTYNYENNGNPNDCKNKMHIGTTIVEIQNGKLQGQYFNNGRDRKTFGSMNFTLETVNKKTNK